MAKAKRAKRPKPMSPKGGLKAGKRYGCGGKLKKSK